MNPTDTKIQYKTIPYPILCGVHVSIETPFVVRLYWSVFGISGVSMDELGDIWRIYGGEVEEFIYNSSCFWDISPNNS